jgi:hypothetical protein
MSPYAEGWGGGGGAGSQPMSTEPVFVNFYGAQKSIPSLAARTTPLFDAPARQAT